jgi:DNA-binding MarR family transcriptional regulator
MSASTARDRQLLENQLCFPLYAASRLMTRLYQPLLDPLGLTYPQYIVMMILWQDSPCSVSHIGERAMLNSNTLTPLLKRLEHQGYIQRRRSESDERVVNVSLSPQGTALKAQSACIPQTLANSVDYAPAKMMQLKSLLDELIVTLAASDLPAPPVTSTDEAHPRNTALHAK